MAQGWRACGAGDVEERWDMENHISFEVKKGQLSAYSNLLPNKMLLNIGCFQYLFIIYSG